MRDRLLVFMQVALLLHPLPVGRDPLISGVFGRVVGDLGGALVDVAVPVAGRVVPRRDRFGAFVGVHPRQLVGVAGADADADVPWLQPYAGLLTEVRHDRVDAVAGVQVPDDLLPDRDVGVGDLFAVV